MTRRRWITALVFGLACPAALGCGWVVFSIGEAIWTTGVEWFFGQVNLTRTSGPADATSYLSNELLLESEPIPEITTAVLVPLPGEIYFWDPGFPGFARTTLTEDDARDLLSALAAGRLFASPDGQVVLCASRENRTETQLAPCQEGTQWRAIHQETRLAAGLVHEVAALRFTFADGRQAEYRLYFADELVAYSAIEVNELPVDGLLPEAAGSVKSMAARAVIGPSPVLWPDVSSATANARAARILGWRYRRALEFLHRLESVEAVVGPIREIRPADAENYSSTWMDSSQVSLTLLVTGETGQAVVQIQGDDCWGAQMVSNGVWYALTSGDDVCPDG